MNKNQNEYKNVEQSFINCLSTSTIKGYSSK